MKTSRTSRTMQVFEATRRQLRRAVTEGVNTAKETADRLTPVDTGYLKSRNQTDDDGQGKAVFENDADYAAHVEFGTSKSAAQPFFRPGVDAGRQKMKSELKLVEK